MKAFGRPLDLDHVVTDFLARNPPHSIINEVRDDTFGEWECFELHIPEQITPSSRRRLVRLVGAKDWRTRREPASPRPSAAETRGMKGEAISEAEYADKKYRKRVEIARRFRQPVPTREQWDEERRLDQQANLAFLARFKRTPEERAEEAVFMAEKKGRKKALTAAPSAARDPKSRFKYAKVLAVAIPVVFAAWLWNIGYHAHGYAHGQVLYCQDDGLSNCDQRYWPAFWEPPERT